MNRPYVKKEWEGAKTKPFPYLNFHPNRAQRRMKPGREFSNKKGLQMVISYWGKGKFSKIYKKLTRFEGKTLVTYKDAYDKS